MKKILTCVIAVAIIASSCLTACKPHPRKESDNDKFAYWIEGIRYSVTVDDNYTFSGKGTETYRYEAYGETRTYYEETEARSGNKYYRFAENYDVDESGDKTLVYSEISSIKVVDDNGVIRTKKYDYSKEEGEEAKARGSYVAPDTAKEKAEYSPKQYLAESGFDKATTSEEVFTSFTEWWYKEKEERNDKLSFSVKRNSDGSVSAIFECKYTAKWDQSEATFVGDCNDVFEYVVSGGKFVKYKERSKYVCTCADNPSLNYTETDDSESTFLYGAFDEEYYNSIDVTTEETGNDYYGYVYFYMEGYLYPVTMYLPVGKTADTEAVKAALVDWNRNCNYNTLIGKLDYGDSVYDYATDEEKAEWIEESKAKNAKFTDALAIYTDSEMTKPFQSITMEEYTGDNAPEYNLYIKITPPEGDAWVISYVESNNNKGTFFIRYIQSCAHYQDGTLRFDANQRLSGYPVIKVDGGEPSEDGQYVFESGSLHILYCENRY